MPSASEDTDTQVAFPPAPEFALQCCCSLLITAAVITPQGYEKIKQQKSLQIQVSGRNKRHTSGGGKNEK